MPAGRGRRPVAEEKPFIIVPRDFFRRQDGLKLRVLGEMLGRADAQGRCHPSHARIAADLDASRARVTRAILELEQERSIERLNKKKPARYQIAERFLVRLSPQRQARSTKGTDQPSLLLPISGSRPPPADAQDGVQKTPSRAGPMVSNRHPHGVQKTPGRESTKSKNPSSSTESGAAREGIRKNGSGSPSARDARPLSSHSVEDVRRLGEWIRAGGDPDPLVKPPPADKTAARNGWLGTLGEFMAACLPAQLEAFWQLCAMPADQARPELNKLDRLMKKSPWYAQRQEARRRRGRACAAGAKLRRSPRRRARRKRIA